MFDSVGGAATPCAKTRSLLQRPKVRVRPVPLSCVSFPISLSSRIPVARRLSLSKVKLEKAKKKHIYLSSKATLEPVEILWHGQIHTIMKGLEVLLTWLWGG